MSETEGKSGETDGGLRWNEWLGWCLILHSWSRWEKIAEGNVMGYTDDGTPIGISPIGTYIRQERRCLRCNKIEVSTKSSLTA